MSINSNSNGAVLPVNAQNDLAIMKLGSFGKSMDVQDHYLWDTIAFPATIPNEGMKFFGKGLGDTFGSALAFSKQSYETNLTDKSRLPTGQTMLLKKVRMSLLSGVEDSDVDATAIIVAFKLLIKHSYWRLQVTEGRSFDWEAPGDIFFPSIFEIPIQTGSSLTTAPVRVGDFNHYSWINIAIPVVLGPLITFGLSVNIGASELQDGTTNTRLSDAIAVLQAQKAAMRITFRGTLVRFK